VKILLVYQTWDRRPGQILLAPEVYFDPLEPGEATRPHGVPRYKTTRGSSSTCPGVA